MHTTGWRVSCVFDAAYQQVASASAEEASCSRMQQVGASVAVMQGLGPLHPTVGLLLGGAIPLVDST